MAWLNSRWRYSVAGVVQPDNPSGFDQQMRFAVANMPIAEELSGAIDGDISTSLGGLTVAFQGTFTPYVGIQADYDESLTLVAIPLPDTGFDVTTRYALGNVAAIGLTESIDRDGFFSCRLDGIWQGVAFTGTHVAPVVDGDLTATLGGLTASFVGEFTYRHYFDISYAVTPTWVVTELPKRFGDISATLGGLTTSFTGFALPPDSTQGRLSSVLGGLTVDFDGAYTAPPTFTGDIAADLAGLSLGFRGTFVPVGSTGGAMSLALDGITISFGGTFEVWNTDGAANLALGGLSVHIEGQFADSDATFGLISTTLEGLSVAFTGTYEIPTTIDHATMSVDTADVAKMRVDTADIAVMKL